MKEERCSLKKRVLRPSPQNTRNVRNFIEKRASNVKWYPLDRDALGIVQSSYD